jgi:hypothetical protein
MQHQMHTNQQRWPPQQQAHADATSVEQEDALYYRSDWPVSRKATIVWTAPALEQTKEITCGINNYFGMYVQPPASLFVSCMHPHHLAIVVLQAPYSIHTENRPWQQLCVLGSSYIASVNLLNLPLKHIDVAGY